MIIYHYNFWYFAEIAIFKCKAWPLPYRLTERSWIMAEVKLIRTCFLGFHIIIGFNGLLLENWTQIVCKNETQHINIWEKNNLIGALFQDKDEYFATPKGKKIVEQNAAEDKKLIDAKFKKLEKKAKKIGARVMMMKGEEKV